MKKHTDDGCTYRRICKAKYCCILIVMSSHPLGFGIALLAR